jgi:acetyl-CoA carboxylase biotin carboxyl carrier protein
MRADVNGLTERMAKDAKSKGSPDQDIIRELAALLEETGLSEIEIEREGMRVRVARQAALAVPAAAPVAAAQRKTSKADAAPKQEVPEDPGKHPGCVHSPMVGTAYLAPEPGSAPFVEVGTRVAQGQTIMIIEAMKTMNHIPAPRSGIVTAVLVHNGQPVEFGEPLAIIE